MNITADTNADVFILIADRYDNAIADYATASRYHVWCADCQRSAGEFPLVGLSNDHLLQDDGSVHNFPNVADPTSRDGPVKNYLVTKHPSLLVGGATAERDPNGTTALSTAKRKASIWQCAGARCGPVDWAEDVPTESNSSTLVHNFTFDVHPKACAGDDTPNTCDDQDDSGSCVAGSKCTCAAGRERLGPNDDRGEAGSCGECRPGTYSTTTGDKYDAHALYDPAWR